MNAEKGMTEFIYHDVNHGAVRVSMCGAHVHLDPQSALALGFRLVPAPYEIARTLRIEGEFALTHRVPIVDASGKVYKTVALLYPWRDVSQLEVTPQTYRDLVGHECPQRRASGDVAGAPTVHVRGPNGRYVEIPIIVPEMHVHAADPRMDGAHIVLTFGSGLVLTDVPVKHNRLLGGETLIGHPMNHEYGAMCAAAYDAQPIHVPTQKVITTLSGTYVIRQAVPEDINPWYQFLERTSDEALGLRYRSTTSRKKLLNYTRIAGRCLSSTDAVFVAVQDGIVGVARMSMIDGELSFLVTDALQHRGIGALLMREVLAYADSADKRVYGKVAYYTNSHIGDLFTKFGFVRTHDDDGWVFIR